jgi:dienelactone hydrolase
MKKTFTYISGALCFLILAGCAGTPETTAGYGFTETPVLIPNGDHDIPAVLTLPIGGGKFPAVVMLHGYGSTKDEAGNGYKLFSPILAENGIASIRIDFMGNGDSKADFVDFDLDKGVSDANAAAAYLASQEAVNPKRIGIMGWSMGGTIAMLSAGRNGLYKSLVTWAGAPDLSLVFDDAGYETAKKTGFKLDTFDWRAPLKLGLGAFESVRKTKVLAELAGSKAPVLAITGSADTTVLPKNADAIAAASAHKKSGSAVINGADHTFNIFTGDLSAYNELTALTLDWFRSTL